MALAGGFLLLGSATTASALNVNRGVRGMQIEQPRQENEQKRAMRQQIRAKQQEYRELRKANDPRAAQVQEEVRAMKAEWTRLYGQDEEMRGRRNGERGNNGQHRGNRKR